MFDASSRERLMKEGVLWASIRLASSASKRALANGGREAAVAGATDADTALPGSSPGSITKPHFLRLRTTRSQSSASLLEVSLPKYKGRWQCLPCRQRDVLLPVAVSEVC